VFKSTKVKTSGTKTFVVDGDLTIRGVTKPATVNVELAGVTADPRAGQRAAFDATASFDRTQWGLVWNMPIPSGVLVSEKITLEANVAATAAAVAVACLADRPAAGAETGDRELSQRTPPGPARLFLQNDAPDLIRRRHDRRDPAPAARTRDASFERIDDILDPLVDLMDVERAIPERQRDPDLELIAVPIADAAAGLHIQHGAVHPATPFVPRSRVCRQRHRDGEAASHGRSLALLLSRG